MIAVSVTCKHKSSTCTLCILCLYSLNCYRHSLQYSWKLLLQTRVDIILIYLSWNKVLNLVFRLSERWSITDQCTLVYFGAYIKLYMVSKGCPTCWFVLFCRVFLCNPWPVYLCSIWPNVWGPLIDITKQVHVPYSNSILKIFFLSLGYSTCKF